MEQQGAAMRQVVSARFERVGQDVVAADLHPGLFRAGEEAGVGVGGYNLARGSGPGGQPAGHRAGSGAYLQAAGTGQRAENGEPAEGTGVVAGLQQVQSAQFVVESRIRVHVRGGGDLVHLGHDRLPKGIEWANRNALLMADSLLGGLPQPDGGCEVSYLPFAHVCSTA